MIDARFVPIVHWPSVPTPLAKQKRAPFKSSYAATLKLLERELQHLKAHSILIQAYFDREAIRVDGWPKGGRAPGAPGIIVTFTSGQAATMSFPCDTYSHWEDNLRAIGLALAALRAIRRYGVGKTTEQYRGFAALPAADPDLKRNQAIAFISRIAGRSIGDVTRDPVVAYRDAARILHPDNGGSHERFVELQGHWDVLNA